METPNSDAGPGGPSGPSGPSSANGFTDVLARFHRKAGQLGSPRKSLSRSKSQNTPKRPVTPDQLGADWAIPSSVQTTPDGLGTLSSVLATPSTIGSARSGRSAFSPRSVAGSTVSDRRSAFCGYCDMPAEYTLKNETVVELECGHSVHLHCFKQLSIVSKDPPCGVCDLPGRLKLSDTVSSKSDRPADPSQLFGGLSIGGLSIGSPTSATSMRRPASAGAASQSSTDFSDHSGPVEFNRRASIPSIRSRNSRPNSATSSLSDAEPRRLSRPSFMGKWKARVPLPLPLSPDTFGPSLLDDLRTPNPQSATSMDSTASSIPTSSSGFLDGHFLSVPELLSRGPNSQTVVPEQCGPVTIGLVPETETVPLNARTFRLLLSVASADAQESQQEMVYRQTAADVQHALTVIDSIANLSFRGMSLSSLRTGSLRLHSILQVDVSKGAGVQWKETECLLFENYLVLIRDGVVKAVLDVASQIDAAMLVSLPCKSSKCLRLVMSGVEVKDTVLWTSDDELLRRWSLALHDPLAEFPLKSPDTTTKSTMTTYPPVYIVLCLPLPHTEKLATAFGQVISSLRNRLKTFDKLGIVFEGGGHEISLQRSSWEEWDAKIKDLPGLVEESGADSFPPDPIRTLNDALKLFGHETSVVTKSGEPVGPRKVVMFVNNKDTSTNAPALIDRLKAVPTLFDDTGVTVHCVGLGESHDLAVTNTIAGNTRGTYNYVREEKDIARLAVRLLRFEQKTTHKDVKLVVKPRVGMRIIGVDGNRNGHSDTSSSSLSSANTAAVNSMAAAARGSRLVSESILENGVLHWPIGWLHKNEAHSVIIDVSVDDSRSVAQAGFRSILHVAVEARNSGSLPTTGEVPSITARVPVTFGDDQRLSPLVAEKLCSLSTVVIFENAARHLAAGHLRQAFQSLSSAQIEIESTGVEIAGTIPPDAIGSVHDRATVIEYFQALGVLYDEFCETILENKPLMRDLFLKIFQHVWLLRTECSILPQSKLEALFKQPL